jgi:FkbM family methyltransferase
MKLKTRQKTLVNYYKSGGFKTALVRIFIFIWYRVSIVWLLLGKVGDRKKIVIRNVLGNKMCLNLSDTGISRELLLFGIHEPISTRIFRSLIKPGMHIIDIGANLGYYAFQEARIVGETGEVIAIEPVLGNVQLLKHGRELNSFKNMKILPIAIGVQNGTSKIFLQKESNCGSMLLPDSYLKTVDVPTRDLDSLFESEQKIDYIRMDVEGFEIEIIKGMHKILDKFKPTLFIEIHLDILGYEKVKRFLEEIKSLGYDSKYIVDKAFEHRLLMGKDNKHIEEMSIDELMDDIRVKEGILAIIVFFETK